MKIINYGISAGVALGCIYGSYSVAKGIAQANTFEYGIVKEEFKSSDSYSFEVECLGKLKRFTCEFDCDSLEGLIHEGDTIKIKKKDKVSIVDIKQINGQNFI